MNCEKCQDTGIIERNHGLEFSFCDCEIGKAIEAKKRAIYGIPEDALDEAKAAFKAHPQLEVRTIHSEGLDNDSNNGTEPDNRDTGSGDTSQPEQPSKPKTKRKARKRAK
ncbi:hypothetical protein ES703_59982 [subsurface metagenome]